MPAQEQMPRSSLWLVHRRRIDLRLEVIGEPFAARRCYRVHAPAFDLAAGDEVAVFQHSQRRLDRFGPWAIAALAFDGERDTEAVPRAVPQDAQDIILDFFARWLPRRPICRGLPKRGSDARKTAFAMPKKHGRLLLARVPHS
ncbi:MAG: hypothetical protein ABSB70_03875 [Candidatus Velthaea sp.]